MTAFVIALVVVVIALAAIGYVVQQKNRRANAERADELRRDAAAQAQRTIAPAQERAAVAEAGAEEARAAAERAEAEAAEARLAAQQEEAAHEARLRAADRLDPRVDDSADDYRPQVPAAEPVQQPLPASEANPAPEVATQDASAQDTSTQDTSRAPLLPRRTPGAQEMPGKPIEQTDGGGGWFTKQPPRSTDTDQS